MPRVREPPQMSADLSSSDDEAPEEVSVSISKQKSISQLQGIRDAEHQKKEEQKEIRRRKNELFRLQKAKKLEELSKRKLPQDVLNAVSANKKKKNQEMKQKEAKNQGSDGADEDDNEDSDGADDDNDLMDRLSDSGLDAGSEEGLDGDFIPLGTNTGIQLVTHKDVVQKKLTVAQQALKFKQDHLYKNQSSVPRQTYQERKAKKAKKLANMR